MLCLVSSLFCTVYIVYGQEVSLASSGIDTVKIDVTHALPQSKIDLLTDREQQAAHVYLV